MLTDSRSKCSPAVLYLANSTGTGDIITTTQSNRAPYPVCTADTRDLDIPWNLSRWLLCLSLLIP